MLRMRARPPSAAGLGPLPAGTAVGGGRIDQAGQILFYSALDHDTAVARTTTAAQYLISGS